MGRSLTFFLIAGEPSGDALGAALMAGLRQLVPQARFAGVGGPLMAAEGLHSLFPMEELSVMGIAEVLPRLPNLLARIRQTAEAAEAARPAAVITIDSPDFCLRVARRLRRSTPDQRIVHYVAPSVWAWRPERAEKMARSVDQVLCLLPFEPPFMERAGLRADFVGHPLAGQPIPKLDEVSSIRSHLQIPETKKICLVLPGSRRGEIDRLTPIFGAALARHAAGRDDLAFVLPTLPHLKSRLTDLTRSWTQPPILVAPGEDPALSKPALFAAASYALAASGTVSLELAAADTPMVIAYDMNWLSRRIIAAKLQIDTVTLVNLVSETRAVPEFLGAGCTPDAIAGALDRVADDAGDQRAAMALTMTRLGRGGQAPGLRAARAVIDGLGQGL